MDYVIFDLEWNQCPYGKGKENPKLPFEIIEIGAVKMDGERNVVGTFHRIVKPVVYQHLHHRTREVVGLTEEDLQNGIPFAQAVQEFFAFSGGACMFGTWGPGDLTELQRNMKFYNLLSLIRGPIHFYDVQKLFAIQYERAFSSGAFGCKIYGRHFCAHRYGCCAGVRLDRRISEPEIEKRGDPRRL